MCMFVHVCVHVCVHVHKSVYIHIWVYMCVCMYTSMYIVQVYVHVWICVHVYVCVCLQTCEDQKITMREFAFFIVWFKYETQFFRLLCHDKLRYPNSPHIYINSIFTLCL